MNARKANTNTIKKSTTSGGNETTTNGDRTISWQLVVRVLVWAGLCVWCVVNEFGFLAVVGSAFYLIYANLGEREAGMPSAYSVFNEDCAEIEGTLNAKQLEKEMLHVNLEEDDITRGHLQGDYDENRRPNQRQQRPVNQRPLDVARGADGGGNLDGGGDVGVEGGFDEDRDLQLALERSLLDTHGAGGAVDQEEDGGKPTGKAKKRKGKKKRR